MGTASHESSFALSETLVCAPWHVCDQRTPCGTQCLPPSVWIPGVKLRFQAWQHTLLLSSVKPSPYPHGLGLKVCTTTSNPKLCFRRANNYCIRVWTGKLFKSYRETHDWAYVVSCASARLGEERTTDQWVRTVCSESRCETMFTQALTFLV